MYFFVTICKLYSECIHFRGRFFSIRMIITWFFSLCMCVFSYFFDLLMSQVFLPAHYRHANQEKIRPLHGWQRISWHSWYILEFIKPYTLAMGFWIWCIHQFRISYFSSANLEKLFVYQRYQKTSPSCKVSDRLVWNRGK